MMKNNELINNVISVLQVMIGFSDKITASQVMTFIVVAEAGDKGISKTAIEKKLKAGGDRITRHIDSLSITGRNNKAGLNLLKRERDPADGRYVNVYLTEKGKALARQVFEES